MVALHVERYFPKSAAPLTTDAQWWRRSGETRLAMAVAADSGMLGEFTRRAADRGWIVDDIRPYGESGARGLSLLPLASRQSRARRERVSLMLSLALAVGGVVVAAGSRTLATHVELRRMEHDVASSNALVDSMRHARIRELDRVHWRTIVKARTDASAGAASL